MIVWVDNSSAPASTDLLNQLKCSFWSPFAGDLQAWIRNSALAPDWLRLGTDIIDGPSPVPTFSMTFALTGETVPKAGVPGKANCHGKSVSALARQFGGLDAAAAALGFPSVQALQDAIRAFCEE